MIIHPQILNGLSALIGGGLAKLIDHLLKVRRLKLEAKKKDPVVEAVKNNILVEFKLEQILEEYEADRVTLIQFHNGGNFYPTGKSIPKFSIFYEKVKPSVSSVREKFQNIPVSIFSKFFNYLSENNMTCFPDIRKATIDDVEIKGLIKDTDSRSSYIVAIKTIDNKFMGVLSIDYTRKKRFLTDDKIKDLQIHGTLIGGELVNHQNNK